ncbi:MAG TPA: Fe-Mn family superoxide dismutase [Thermoanaerobaculia bacterium]|nr:Fe-Mn family superoxide dismutase [Thermoanaerobaculia bacterium]
MALYSTKDFSRLLGTPGFSDALLKQHFELYAGYVKNANALHDELEASAPAKPPTPAWSELRRRFGWEWNGMRLHEMYFGNLTRNARPAGREAPLVARIGKDFGSKDAWEREFRATGGLRGIGWAALVWDPSARRLFDVWIDEHDRGALAGCPILLVMDVFEHAFMMDYGTKRADYIDAFLAAVDWEEVARRFEAAQVLTPDIVRA